MASARETSQTTVRTLRVCSIPAPVTEVEFKTYLTKLLGYEDFILSFVASSGGGTVATVTLTNGEPATLSECSAGKRIYLPYPGTLVGLVVDCDFLGMTPLYSDESPVVDIVAITRLAGHAYGSWKARDKPWMWLRDFLPADLLHQHGHKVRILTFGFSSALSDGTTTPSIQHYARTLFDNLASERKGENERHRPIVFIGHSVGGLVVKQALADASQSKNPHESDTSILRCCKGLFFFGVPNRGLNIENLRTLVKDQKNEYFINDLREGSELMWQSNQNFTQCPELQGCHITSCYELRDTQAVVVDDNRRWTRSGKMIRVVTRESATFTLPTEKLYQQLGIDADHLNMVKFSDNHDHRYLQVMERLSQCIGSTPITFKDGASNRVVFMLPTSQNRNFVGREATIQKLDWLLSTKGRRQLQRAALYGLGGTGKTSIAIEFCYRRKKTQPQAHIFWLHGNSHETFNDSCLQLGSRVNILSDVDEERPLVRVKEWLESSASGDWIIIIDNFDNVDSYIAKYLPVKGGTILYTTRDQRLVGNLQYVPSGCGVKIDAMSGTEAFEMFTGALAIDTTSIDNKAVLDLLDRLEKLPLAISQAAAYIQQTEVPIPVYLEMFSGCETDQRLLMGEGWAAVNEGGKRSAAVTTWKLTIDKIQEQNPASVRLLEVMSFLCPDDIPGGLLKGFEFHGKSDACFYAALAPLLTFSMIYRLESSNYRLHRLVSLCVRTHMDSEGGERKHKCLETIVPLLNNRFPRDDMLAHHRKCMYLVAHAVAVLGHTTNGPQSLGKAALALQHNLGRILCESGNATGGLMWYQRALDGREKRFGKDDLQTLSSVNAIASAFQQKADYCKALEWYQRALDGREELRGKEHPDTIQIVHNMARVFQQQGDYDKALVWYQRALDGREKVLGNADLQTLRTVYGMAQIYRVYGEYAKALEWYRRVLDGREGGLGKDHPSTLEIVHSMAQVFRDLGDHRKAFLWCQRALDGREKVLGKDHPHTLQTVHSMALCFRVQGEYGKANTWCRRALDGREKTFGVNHPNTIDTVECMALVLRDQGEYDNALVWTRRALDGREMVLGKDHLNTHRAVNNMAILFWRQRDFSKALEWYQRALDGYTKVLGRAHPDTLRAIQNMALVFRGQKDYEKAMEWYQEALDGCEKALGKDHPETLRVVQNMATVFQDRSEYSKALVLYQRALDGYERVFGNGHPSTLRAVYKIAQFYQKRGDSDKALDLYQRAVDGREKALGETHPDTLTTLFNLALIFQKCGDSDKALDLYQRVLDGREKALPENHPDTVNTLFNMALISQKRGDSVKALDLYQLSLNRREKKAPGNDNADTLSTVHNIALIYQNLGGSDKALQLYQRALDGREKALGKDHAETLTTVHNMALIYQNRDDPDKALGLYQRALGGREKALGKDHLTTLGTVYNMAMIFHNRGEYGKALEWYQRALDGREKALGKDDPEILYAVYNMAIIFEFQEEHEKALTGYQRVLAARENVLGKDHPDTLVAAEKVASVIQLQKTGKSWWNSG